VTGSVAQNYLEMIMRKDIRRIFVTALAVAAFSASAFAGMKSASDVVISDTYGWAYGDAGHVYKTSDRTQYITCEVRGTNGSCLAVDVNGVFRQCSSSEARWVRTMAAVKGDSYIVFYWDANGSCTYVGVQNDSLTDRK
jgi:hypothetical protein